MSRLLSLFHLALTATIVLLTVRAQIDGNELAIDEPVSEFGNLLAEDLTISGNSSDSVGQANGDPNDLSQTQSGLGNATIAVNEPQLPPDFNTTGVDPPLILALNNTESGQLSLIQNSTLFGPVPDSDNATEISSISPLIQNRTVFEPTLGDNSTLFSSDNATEISFPSMTLNGTVFQPILDGNSTGIEVSPVDANSTGFGSSVNSTNVLLTVDIQALVQKLDATAPLVSGLLSHSKQLSKLTNLTVESNGEKWTFSDICHRLPSPRATVRGEGVFADVIANIFDAISPCVVISPLDCFSDGGKALGPFPPYDPGLAARALFPSLQSLDDGEGIAWTTLDFNRLGGDFENMGSIFANVSSKVIGTFDSAVDKSYSDRPCLDPIDPQCPTGAPNKFDICTAVDQYAAWKEKQGTPVVVDLAKKSSQSVRQRLQSLCTVESPDATRCKQLAPEVRAFIEEHRAEGIEFLNGNASLPQPPQETLSKLTSKGCEGVFNKIMNWPKELIVDQTKDADGKSVVQQLRTVLPLNNAEILFNRYKNGHPTKPGLDASNWSVKAAQQVIDAWKSEAAKVLSDNATLEAEPSDGSESFPTIAIEKLGPTLQKVKNFYDKLEKLEREENL
uniref:Uncharacterized protein n=1 Tax=Plectus sambesii TaxID=2011161 RepID=A0A914VBG3_9BILA